MLKNGQKQVGLVFFPAFDWAISATHPERQERLLYTRDQIEEEGLFDHPAIKEYRPQLATTEQLCQTHIFVPNLERHVSESHLIAAGGTILAGDLVLTGQVDRAFALLRPPGHHSKRVVHGNRGFCTINNEAILVDQLRSRLGPDLKVAIVDTDAHHGDGTQDIFYNDPGVLHISLHQDGRTLYPGTGFIEERGGPGAYGQTVNIPLPPGTGDQGMLMVMERVVLPILQDWQPDYVINAAGQDNHYSDPLTNMRFTAHGYAQLTELLNPDIVVLEGGYSIESALPYINVGLLLALAGLDYSKVQEPKWALKDVQQPANLDSEIARICDQVLILWQNRTKVNLPEIFGRGQFFERQRSIYYDTDNVHEKQHEYIRLCPNCPGWRVIYTSSTSFKQPVAAITLPWQVCSTCLQEAQKQQDQHETDPQFAAAVWQQPNLKN